MGNKLDVFSEDMMNLALKAQEQAKKSGHTLEEYLEALLDGYAAKRIAESNSEGDHTAEAINYINKQ